MFTIQQFIELSEIGTFYWYLCCTLSVCAFYWKEWLGNLLYYVFVRSGPRTGFYLCSSELVNSWKHCSICFIHYQHFEPVAKRKILVCSLSLTLKGTTITKNYENRRLGMVKIEKKLYNNINKIISKVFLSINYGYTKENITCYQDLA